MKHILSIIAILFVSQSRAQVDPSLLRRVEPDTAASMNMDAVYARPFMQVGKLPVQLGGYAEANYQYLGENGITEGHQFQMRRVSIFLSSTVTHRIKFLTEIEFEDGAKEIGIEFASMDIEFHPMLNFRGGIVLNPIGGFNQNHDGPKWDFIDRPISATQMLPATWSNAGFGFYGKNTGKKWMFGYEVYMTNGFDDKIIANAENKTFLPASKANRERFEESFNGAPLWSAKLALRNRPIGELGISYMGGVYNKFREDGLVLDKKRRVDVFAVDGNFTVPRIQTTITGEWAWVKVDVPDTYTEQFGERQRGGFIDFVQPVIKKPMFGFDDAVLNAGLRLEYVDWNKGSFSSSGTNIADDIFAIVPAISFRPGSQTVLRVNYRYAWQRDILGNPASRLAGIQFGISTYF
jgi:hypothetical protein